MIVYIAISTIVLLFGFYNALGDWVYRHPWALLVVGVFAAALAAMLKGWSIPALRPEELQLATMAIDPLLGGLAGGLVASAVIIKLQVMHAKAQTVAYDAYEFACDEVDHAKRHYQRMQDSKVSAPANESDKDVERAISMLQYALERKIKDEKRLRAVLVPGLGDSK